MGSVRIAYANKNTHNEWKCHRTGLTFRKPMTLIKLLCFSLLLAIRAPILNPNVTVTTNSNNSQVWYKGSLHKWFHSSLESHAQCVKKFSYAFEVNPIVCGVIQGRVLDHLFFTICLNDGKNFMFDDYLKLSAPLKETFILTSKLKWIVISPISSILLRCDCWSYG